MCRVFFIQATKQCQNSYQFHRYEALEGITNPLVIIEIASHMGSLNNVLAQILKNEKVELVAMRIKEGQEYESALALLKQKNCPTLLTSP